MSYSINMNKVFIFPFLFLLFLGCKKENSAENQFPKESKFERTETPAEASPEDKQGIESAIKGFLSWYQQNFGSLFTYEDVKGGGAGKQPFQVNWDGVNGLLKEMKKCPDLDDKFFENEIQFYKKWEDTWKEKPETKQIPDIFQIDRYLCSAEPDMIFSLIEKTNIAIAVKGETATALMGYENGNRLPFELQKREGKWRISRIICE